MAGNDTSALPFPIEPSATPGAHWEIDWRPAVRRVLASPPDAPHLAAACHRGLARAIVDVARQAGVGTVVLTGGCFQNALLAGRVVESIGRRGLAVSLQRRVPSGDGGLCLGQAVVAAAFVRNGGR